MSLELKMQRLVERRLRVQDGINPCIGRHGPSIYEGERRKRMIGAVVILKLVQSTTVDSFIYEIIRLNVTAGALWGDW